MATIGRITADGDVVEYALPIGDDAPEEIVLGPDGNSWFTIDINSIGRITPQGSVKIFATPTQDAGPLGIAVGPGTAAPRSSQRAASEGGHFDNQAALGAGGCAAARCIPR